MMAIYDLTASPSTTSRRGEGAHEHSGPGAAHRGMKGSAGRGEGGEAGREEEEEVGRGGEEEEGVRRGRGGEKRAGGAGRPLVGQPPARLQRRAHGAPVSLEALCLLSASDPARGLVCPQGRPARSERSQHRACLAGSGSGCSTCSHTQRARAPAVYKASACQSLLQGTLPRSTRPPDLDAGGGLL